MAKLPSGGIMRQEKRPTPVAVIFQFLTSAYLPRCGLSDVHVVYDMAEKTNGFVYVRR